MGTLDELLNEKQSTPSGVLTEKKSGSLATLLAPAPTELDVSVPQAGDINILDTLERGVKLTGSNILEAGGFQEQAATLLESAPKASIPNFRQIEDVETTGQFITERTLESAPNIALSGGSAALGFALGGPIGAAIGFTLGSGIPLLGEARREIREEGGEGSVLEALVPAAANTALEALPIAKIAKILGVGKVFRRNVDEVLEEAAAQKSVIEKGISAIKETGQLAVTEGAVEATQELNNKLAGKFFADKEVLALSDEDFEQLKQAFAGGLAGGTGSSIAAQPIAAALTKIDVIQSEKKQQKIRDSVEGQLQEFINQKKKDLGIAEELLKTQGEAFDPLAPFTVFKGLQGQDANRSKGPLPTGKTGFGPNTQENYKSENTAATILGIGIARKDADGNTISVPLGQAQKVDKSIAGIHDVSAKSVKISKFTDGELKHSDIFEQVRQLYEEILDKMGIQDLDVIIGDSKELAPEIGINSAASSQGWIVANDKGNIIALDMDALMGKGVTKQEALGAVWETAVHELGHAIIKKQWETASSLTKNGLLQGYRQWLEDVQTMSGKEFTKSYRGVNATSLAPRQFGGDKPFRDTLLRMDQKTRAYFLSFDEYAAQMMVAALEGKGSKFFGSDEAKTFWQDMLTKMKEMWEALAPRFRTEKTFEAFVNSLLLRKEIADLQEVVLEMQNPTGDSKDTQRRTKVFLEKERGGLTESDYIPVTPSLMADTLERMGLSREAQDMRHHQDISLGFMRLSSLLTPLQLSELARKAGIQNPGLYMDLVKEFSNTKMKQVVRADEIAQKWRSLGKTKNIQLGNFLYAVSDKSDEEGRRLNDSELAQMREIHKVDDETFALYQEIDSSFREILANIERGLVLDASKSFIDDPKKATEFRDLYMLAQSAQRKLQLIIEFTGLELIPLEGDRISNPLFDELNRINKSIAELRNKNYFPRTRLGQYTITIRSTKKGQEWEGHVSQKQGETLGFYSFESSRERDALMQSMSKELTDAGLSFSKAIMDTEVFAMMGMPEALIQQITNSSTLNLNDAQKQQLKDISLNLSPGKRFLRHLKKRRGIVGFSKDALRVYSTYMMSASNHLARVEHAKSMVQALQTFKNDIKNLEDTNLGGDISDLIKIKDYFSRHFDYLMKPDNDWAQLRSLGFLWYLGFNVKSALVNLTQIPMVTFPVMAGRFGDAKSAKALASAYRDIPRMIKKGFKLAEDEMDMLQHLRDTGILDESMVMELAGMGEADILQRAVPGWDRKNIMTKVSYYGGAMFRMAEKFNRTVTALAAFRLARDQGLSDPTGYAREVIEKSQFEYSKWNRAEFMRGKKSVIFLFWQYMQHASFLFFGGEGSKVAMRMWILALFIAGVEGLPFAKTFLELINLGGTKVQEAMGVANPRVTLEEDMRTLLLEITDEPDLVMRGMSSYWGLGPLHLLSLVGAPIPNIDISGSLSFGSPVQFLDEALTGQGSPDEEIGKLATAILGPVGGMVLQGYRSWVSTDPDDWKNLERAMPIFMKNAMQGVRWMDEGKETFRGGGEFLNMDRPEHRVAAFMKFLGFQNTRLTQKYNQVTSQQEAAVYWTLRKQLLLEDYSYALHIDDREAKKDVLDGIKAHNKAMRKVDGLKGLAISSKDMRQSLRARQRSRVLRERGIPAVKGQRPLFKAIAEAFPVTAK